MAADQKGTGSLTVAGQAALAATYITVPANSIIESVTVNDGGSPQYEDQSDEDGKLHTRITFEAEMHTATVVVVGAAYASSAGDVDGSSSNYYVESTSAETSKGPVRTTITLTRIPTIA
jgi:hypothetical protein